MKSEDEKAYEERVKKRVLLLQDKLKSKTIFLTEEQQEVFSESFNNVRFDRNGAPILETVDGRIRSMALAIEMAEHRHDLKEAISLQEIQELYFGMVEIYFEHFYKMMLKHKGTPHSLAENIAYGGQDLKPLLNAAEDFMERIVELWEATAESGYTHLEDESATIKAVFGGDLFPHNGENIASKCGIYTDTILLPCPFIRTKPVFERMNEQQRAYFILKHAMNVLKYKVLATAGLEHPIVVVLPDKEMMDEFSYEQIRKVGEVDALYHASKLFDRQFESLEELHAFGNELDTVDKVMNEIKDESKALFDLNFKEPLRDQILTQIKDDPGQILGTKSPGVLVALNGFGRMSVCNELLFKSTRVGGVPLIEAPTSWEYFKWKLEYDAERANPKSQHKDLHVVKGLNGLSNTHLNWIGRIPPKGLIELRKSGAINEIRHILSKGIEELTSSEPMDFQQTSHKVFNNLNRAFTQHQNNINELIEKKWKVAGKDFGSWLVMGTVEIASACVGTPLYGISTVVLNQLMDAPKIKDLPKSVDKIKAIEEQKKNLKKSPIGLMFSYKE